MALNMIVAILAAVVAIQGWMIGTLRLRIKRLEEKQ